MGAADLDAFIERMKKLGATAQAAVAREAAPLVQDALRATAAAGTDPNGNAWPTKKDGGRAMPNVADKITARAVGPTIEVEVTGGAAIQQRLKTWRRATLPEGDLPKGVVAALQEGARRAFDRAWRS